MPSKDLENAIRDLIDSMDSLQETVADLDVTMGGVDPTGSGGGGAALGATTRGGGAAPSKPGGGLLDLVESVRTHPGVAAAAGVAAFAAPSIARGIESAALGGDFEAGFETQLNRTLGRLPFFARVGQAAQVEERTTQRVGQAVGEIEALGGRISPEVRDFLIQEAAGQETRRAEAQTDIRLRAEQFFRDNPTGPRFRNRDFFGFLFGGVGGVNFERLQEAMGLEMHK